MHVVDTWLWLSCVWQPQEPLLWLLPHFWVINMMLWIDILNTVDRCEHVINSCQSPGNGAGHPQKPLFWPLTWLCSFIFQCFRGRHLMPTPIRTSWICIPSDKGLINKAYIHNFAINRIRDEGFIRKKLNSCEFSHWNESFPYPNCSS